MDYHYLILIKQIEQEVERIREVYNKAWERNWGFVPVTDDEFLYMANKMKHITNPEMCILAEQGDTPVGFMLDIPDINVLLRKINGRLLPFGFLV